MTESSPPSARVIGWTASFMLVGFVIGLVLAIVVPFELMQIEESRTGHGAGDVGLLFCCTLPLFPVVGLAIGGVLGQAIERRNECHEGAPDADDELFGKRDRCPDCDYDLTKCRDAGCPECGWGR